MTEYKEIFMVSGTSLEKSDKMQIKTDDAVNSKGNFRFSQITTTTGLFPNTGKNLDDR
jgi:hypothetical protein